MTYFIEKTKELETKSKELTDELNFKIDKLFPYLINIKSSENFDIEMFKQKVDEIEKMMHEKNQLTTRIDDIKRFDMMTGV